MRDFFATNEATQDSFLFISYSHSDQDAVKNWADYLISKGVRIWRDTAFLGGDDWETIATNLLSHENCRGFLFFCSPDAIKSPNVAKEWRTAAKTSADRDDFYAQIIMVSDDPDFNYKYLTNFVKKNEDLFSDEDYDDFRDLFGKKDHLYYCASNEDHKEALIQTIKRRAADAVDETAVAQEQWTDQTNQNKEVIAKLGTYGADHKPMLWHQIRLEENTVTLLCQQVLAEAPGGDQLEKWLQDFTKTNFSQEEQAAIQGNIRLLTAEESAAVPQEELAAEVLWWLADRDGNLQSVIREDGTLYPRGYNVKLCQKGVRPVITGDISALLKIVNK